MNCLYANYGFVFYYLIIVYCSQGIWKSISQNNSPWQIAKKHDTLFKIESDGIKYIIFVQHKIF